MILRACQPSQYTHQLLVHNLEPGVHQHRYDVQVAELGGENEQLQWQLQSAQKKLRQAEDTAQQLQHNQSDGSSTSQEQDSGRSSHLQSQLEELGRHNSELQSELTAAVQNMKQEEAKGVKQQHQIHDQADHMAWELQHKVDNLTQENHSLLKHHKQLETRFESLTGQLAKAQHAQHAQHAAEAQSKACEAQTLSKTTALQEQIDNLQNSSAAHLEVRHRLQNEVTSLQRQLGHTESALSQQQNRARNHQQAEAATSGQVAALQQQAESVVQENATLERQCRQQAADMKQLQSDVQVGHSGRTCCWYRSWCSNWIVEILEHVACQRAACQSQNKS